MEWRYCCNGYKTIKKINNKNKTVLWPTLSIPSGILYTYSFQGGVIMI